MLALLAYYTSLAGAKTLFWEIALFFTGVLSVYRAVSIDICYQCLGIILEISFVFIPLCISFAHPFLMIWFVMAVRNASIRICPIISKIMPEYEMPTPPLPEHSPHLPRRNEPQSISQILIRSPKVNRTTS
uniref:Uncharacterized protein n=1 Tax=Acrobeloides nanus TaxID=290746 RepID=A0A914ENM0_9BILA